MSALLVELAGPQQAWGSRSRFATRATELAPTKSGVVGLLAAALGMPRSAPLDRFDDLTFAVRVDQPGRVERDFQTTRSLDGTQSFPLSTRYYLADAVFLAAIGADDEAELEAYRGALQHPHYPLFLGRRAFPPAGPLEAWIVDHGVRDALQEAAWRARPHHRRTVRGEQVSLQVIADAEPNDPLGESRRDIPRSFDPRRREHDWRDVAVYTVSLPHPEPRPLRAAARGGRADAGSLLGSATDHDPEALLADEEV